MTLVYLDSSAIVKRYVMESGSTIINEVYHRALKGELTLVFSIWNIGEVLGVLDKYLQRKWLSIEGYKAARRQFLGETLRLLRLRLLRIVPVKARLLLQAWSLVEKYHVYEADALQVVSAKYVGALRLYTGDEQVHGMSLGEGVSSILVK